MRTIAGRVIWGHIIEKNGTVHSIASGVTEYVAWHDIEEGSNMGGDSPVFVEIGGDES